MKEKAKLEKDLADERKKTSHIQTEITSIRGSITRNTSSTLQQSKQRQIDSKLKDLAHCQKKLADLEAKISEKLSALTQNLRILEQAEKQEQKKQDADDKRRRAEELRHAQSVTYEARKQVQLQKELRDSRLVIDLARLPETIKVFFVASNPLDQSQLRLDEEIREIAEQIRASEYRDSVQLISRWAARPRDLLQALNELKPHIVHFSGHGSSSNDLVFQSDDGSTKLVSKEAIVTTMSTVTDNIRLVVFNACFSCDQAEAVTQHVEAAIGMNDAIGDDAARVFAAQLYSAIGFGRSLEQAFGQGIAALLLDGIPEEKTPALFTQVGVDATNIVLVCPPSLVTGD
jgi:CHAT domain-containing protein